MEDKKRLEETKAGKILYQIQATLYTLDPELIRQGKVKPIAHMRIKILRIGSDGEEDKLENITWHAAPQMSIGLQMFEEILDNVEFQYKTMAKRSHESDLDAMPDKDKAVDSAMLKEAADASRNGITTGIMRSKVSAPKPQLTHRRDRSVDSILKAWNNPSERQGTKPGAFDAAWARRPTPGVSKTNSSISHEGKYFVADTNKHGFGTSRECKAPMKKELSDKKQIHSFEISLMATKFSGHAAETFTEKSVTITINEELMVDTLKMMKSQAKRLDTEDASVHENCHEKSKLRDKSAATCEEVFKAVLKMTLEGPEKFDHERYGPYLVGTKKMRCGQQEYCPLKNGGVSLLLEEANRISNQFEKTASTVPEDDIASDSEHSVDTPDAVMRKSAGVLASSDLYAGRNCTKCKKSVATSVDKYPTFCRHCSPKDVIYCSRACRQADRRNHREYCWTAIENMNFDYRPAKQGHLAADTKKSKLSKMKSRLTYTSPHPFRSLENGTWLHNRPLNDICILLIDSFRLNEYDFLTQNSFVRFNGIWGRVGDSYDALSSYIVAAVGDSLLPAWFDKPHFVKCLNMSFHDPETYHSIRRSIGPKDIKLRYGEESMMVAQMRIFAWQVLKREPRRFYMPEFLDAHVQHERSGIPMPPGTCEDSSLIGSLAVRCTCGLKHSITHRRDEPTDKADVSDYMSMLQTMNPTRAMKRSKRGIGHDSSANPDQFLKGLSSHGRCKNFW